MAMRRHCGALIPALAVVATCTFAQTPDSARDAVDAYVEAISLAESGATRGSIEPAMAALEDLERALLADVPDGDASVLESLAEADFAPLAQLPGVLVRRVEIVFVRPGPRFFVALATRVGDEADRRFAEALAATYPDGHWPVYVEPRTDYAGCTAFGNGRLLRTYRAWSAMAHDFPDRYARLVARERTAVAEQITSSSCACGDAESVARELARIATSLTPTEPILAAVDARLAALEPGRSGIRFGCVPG